jgi:hypothetical protein
MIDDLEDGGSEGIGDIPAPPEEKKRLTKPVTVLLVTAIVLGAYLVIWVALPPTLRIEELIEKYDDDWDTPSFDRDLAGKSLRIEGTVTYFYSRNMTRGVYTVIELDDYWYFKLIELKKPTFEIGDIIVRDIHFEWGRFNNYAGVFSPQIERPVWRQAFDSSSGAYTLSAVADPMFRARDNGHSDHVILDVYLRDTDGLPVEFYNASLRMGLRYSDDSRDVRECYSWNPELDRIESLEQSTGTEGNLRYVDGNSNGLLDNGDHFEMDLTRPTEDSSVYSYLFLLNGGACEGGILGAQEYIIMTKKGIFQDHGAEYPEESSLSSGRWELTSETFTSNGVTAEIVVSHSWGPSWPIHFSRCWLRWSDGDLDSPPLGDGMKVADDGNITITFSDVNKDGIFNVGDMFVISGLEAWTKYELRMYGIPDYREIEWIAGMGPRTQYVPIIEWRQPVALDPPTNLDYKIQIDRMYGVPGVPLNDSKEKMVVGLTMNGNEIFSDENLTHNFSHGSTGLNITFSDADGNGVLNTGDFFICTSNSQAEFKLSLSYVNENSYPHRRFDQPLITWPISWQTG